MIALGIETATAVCGVALLRDGAPVVERIVEKANVHSEQLVPMIGEILEVSGVNVKDLDVIAVSIGPGSFTGLRIGLSVAKGLSVSADTALVAVPTLESLACTAVMGNRAGVGDEIVSLLDAHRGEAYWASYTVAPGGCVEMQGAAIAPYGDIEEQVCRRRNCIVVGGELRYQFNEEFRRRLIQSRCSPAAVVSIGARKFRAGEKAERTTLEPLYIREFIPRADDGVYLTNKGA